MYHKRDVDWVANQISELCTYKLYVMKRFASRISRRSDYVFTNGFGMNKSTYCALGMLIYGRGTQCYMCDWGSNCKVMARLI